MRSSLVLIASAPTCAQLSAQYAHLAPLLLVLGRLMQGLSQGGEQGTSYAMLIEIDHKEGRGFRSAMDLASSGVAGLCAAATVLILTHTMSAHAVTGWGWRIPFVIGACVAPIGLLLRTQMADDRPTGPIATMRATAREASAHWKRLMLCILASQGTSVGFVIIGFYLPVHVMHWLGLALKNVHWIGIATSTTMVLTIPLFGLWSDRIKRRKPFALVGRLVGAALLIPAYWLINHYPSLPLIMGAAAFTGLFLGMAASTASTLVTEGFPQEVRATAASVCFATVGALFGATTQVIVIAAVNWSNNLLAPAIYATICLLVSATAVWLLEETGAREAS